MLHNALYIPSYNQNIFSVSAEVDRGASVILGQQVSTYTTEEGKVFEIRKKGRLYYLNSISSSVNNASSIQAWHRILGHCNYGDVRKLEKIVKGMKITDYEEAECEVCTQGKMCQTRNREPDQRASAPLEFVHCDLAGPIEPVAKDGFKYALSFVDDFSGTNIIYILRQKSDTLEATEKFLADAAPYGKVMRLRSDNGGEQPRTQALHCFYRDQWQLINAKRARVLGQHATGNCSVWQKMHQTWRTSYAKRVRRKIPSC